MMATEINLETLPTVHQNQPVAFVQGQAVTQLPKDLHIPPEAMAVFLSEFEGPLDLLLYLIKQQNLDIIHVAMTPLIKQYLDYIELMQALQLDLASEYLVMAALLLEIKSRMLLPRTQNENANQDDPKTRLIQQLQSYAQIKKAAVDLDKKDIMGRDTFIATVTAPKIEQPQYTPQIPLETLVDAMRKVLAQQALYRSHQITKEPLSIKARMAMTLNLLKEKSQVNLSDLFTLDEGRAGVVVSLLAILELSKAHLIEFQQEILYAPITVWAVNGA